MQRYWIGVMTFVWISSLNTANADWQYTKWQMTPTEVITASGGKVVSTDEQRSRKGPNKGLLKGNYASGQFQFKVVFYFNENTNLLSVIQLTLLDPTLGYTLEQSLVAKYGKPLESFAMSPGRIIRWQDQSNNNRIEVIHIEPRLVTLSYYPFRTADNKGL